jgi:hypothetical protein
MGNVLGLIATCLGNRPEKKPGADHSAGAPPRQHPRPKMNSRADGRSNTPPRRHSPVAVGNAPADTQPLLPNIIPQRQYPPINMDKALSNTQSPLLATKIPTEIHLAIVSYLPLSAVIALTLTCKRFLHIIGTSKSWEELPNVHPGRSVFYSLLERDLTGYYHRWPTDTCLSKRHSMPTPKNFVQEHYPKDYAYAALAERFDYTIAWSHVALLFKRGPGGLALDGFHPDVTKPLVPVYGSEAHSCSVNLVVTPKIVDERLLLGYQYRITPDTRPAKMSIEELRHFDMSLCRHVSTQVQRSPW